MGKGDYTVAFTSLPGFDDDKRRITEAVTAKVNVDGSLGTPSGTSSVTYKDSAGTSWLLTYTVNSVSAQNVVNVTITDNRRQ